MAKIIKDRDFSGLDLRNVNGNDLTFFRCKFDRANLANSTFENAQFIYCSFNRTSWQQSNLSYAKFRKDDRLFNELADNYRDLVDLHGDEVVWPRENELRELSDLSECTGHLSSFRRSNLFCASFNGYDLDDSDFSEADLSGASFIDTYLNHCSFKDIRFVNEWGYTDTPRSKVLFGANTSLEFTDFSDTNLKGLHFKHCKTLEAANFRRADLEGANFEGDPKNDAPMSLYRACFDNVRLTKASFDNCILDSASFISSDLRQVIFSGTTRGIAAIFSNSYLGGCQAKKINFTASNFSGTFIGTDEEEGIVPASFVGSTMTSAIFSSAALIGVNFDNAHMDHVDFDSATFTTKQKTLNGENESNNEGEDVENQNQTMSFNCTSLEKAVFRSVNLNGYHFVDCNADGAIFDSSELEDVKFIKTSLRGASFEECYLPGVEFYPESKNSDTKINCQSPKLPLKSASFLGSNLSNAKFYHADLVSSDFKNAALNCARFHESKLRGANFENSSLDEAVFNQCNLKMVNFEKVRMDGAKIHLASDLSAAQFLRAHGKQIELTIKNDLSPQAVVFQLSQLSGTIQASILGAIVEYSEFDLCKNSKLICRKGFHCTGSLFKVNGALHIDSGLIENSTLNVDSCLELSVKSSTLRGSSLEGLNKNCSFPEGCTFESCSLAIGWEKVKFDEAKINLTSIEKGSYGDDFKNLELKHIDRFDKSSISALKANAESMGHDKVYDKFFDLEKEKEIQLNKEKKGFYLAAIFTSFLFFCFPGVNRITETISVDSGWGYCISMLLLSLSIAFVYQTKVTFLKWLYHYGHNFYNITRSIFIIIIGFTFSFILNGHFGNGPKLPFWSSLTHSFHSSINSFVAIGFWDSISEGGISGGVSGPQGIMILYTNIEAMLGIIAMALLVVTIIRRTSGR